MSDEVDFLHADKHQGFLQVGNIFFGWFNPAWPKWSTLQHLQKEVRKEVHFLLPKLILSFLTDVVRHVQNTQNNKFVISYKRCARLSCRLRSQIMCRDLKSWE